MGGTITFVIAGVLALAGAALVVVGKSGGSGTPCLKCKRVMLPEWTQCLFCGSHPALLAGQPGKLHFVTGPNAGKALILEKPVTSLGSAPGNDVVLGEAGVSRRHAGIRRLPPDPGCAGGGYELADLGSTNGVTINGEKKPKKVLAVGDIIRIGSTEMIFRV